MAQGRRDKESEYSARFLGLRSLMTLMFLRVIRIHTLNGICVTFDVLDSIICSK